MLLRDHIKKIALVLVLVSVALLLYVHFNPLFNRSPFFRDHPPVGEKQSRQLKVLDYGSNRIGDVDKFLFEYDGRQSWLHFPPHTAKFVMHAAPKNTMVEAVFVDPGQKGADEKTMYELLSVKSVLASFAVQDVPPPAPVSGKVVELSGKIMDYKLDEKGMVAGFVMEQYIIEIPKHSGQNLVPLLKSAAVVIVKGYERNDQDGFVNITGFTLVKPYSVMIGQTNYLL